jgi:murein DD-endopeptidase MepM/ murein hydrolase activator NlpD
MRPSPRPRRRAKRILAAAALAGAALAVVALAVLAVRHFVAPSGPASAPSAKAAEAPAGPPAPPSPPPLEVEKLLIPRGTSLARLLRGHGFSDKEIHRLQESVRPVYNLAKIAAGHEVRLFRTAGGAWKRLEYDVDEARYLVVLNEAEAVTAEVKAYPFEFRTALVSGVIETSPVAAMARIGEEDVLAYDLAERCFGWDIDFYTDLRKGDTFRILVEKKILDGKFAGYRNILAAEFVNEGKTFQAFRFAYPDTFGADYFDENGLSKRKEFLKSPFKYGAHVTSRFSGSRLHPIYKVYRAHYGVDYGAPEGTPVQATADGKVAYAGWNDGSGQQVRLQHKNGYETIYSHLSRYGPGIRSGVQVRGGDVVGYVGSTGDATGPHLDYRVHYHGAPINPLGQKFKPADPVRKEFRDAYEKDVRRLRQILDLPKLVQYAWPRFSF